MFPCFNNCCANISLGICVRGAICRFPGLLVFTADKFSQFGEVGALAAVSDVAAGEEVIALRGGDVNGGGSVVDDMEKKEEEELLSRLFLGRLNSAL